MGATGYENVGYENIVRFEYLTSKKYQLVFLQLVLI